jgi:hypothetical protein
MLVSTGMNWTQGLAEERLMQLLRLMNRLLDKHPDSRRRLLAWHTPVMIPVWQQVGRGLLCCECVGLSLVADVAAGEAQRCCGRVAGCSCCLLLCLQARCNE